MMTTKNRLKMDFILSLDCWLLCGLYLFQLFFSFIMIYKWENSYKKENPAMQTNTNDYEII